MRYAVIIEKAEGGFGAYVPDLPGCVALGETRSEIDRLIKEAVAIHIGDLRAQGLPIPEPTSACEYIEVEGT